MLDRNNYTIESKMVSPQGKFPPQWEVTVINKENNLRCTLVCQSMQPPPNDEIFNIFCDKTEFKKHFFLEAEIIEIAPEITTEIIETAPEIVKEIDIPIENATINTVTNNTNT